MLKWPQVFNLADLRPARCPARSYPCPSPDVRLGLPGRGSLHVRGASASCLRLLP